MRRIFLLVLLTLLLVPSVSAREILNADTCVVEEDEVIEGALFAFCENLYIHGTVNGDVYGATVRTDIDGIVTGSIYLVAAQLDVTGEVRQDLNFGGIALRLNPPQEIPNLEMHRVSRRVNSLSLSTQLYENTVVDEGILGLGYQLIMQGDVQHEVNFWGSTLFIGGEVQGDVYAVVGDPNSDSSQIEALLIPLQLDLSLRNPGLILEDAGAVQGNLHYTGPYLGDIQGNITGDTDFTSTLLTIPTLDEPGAFNVYIENFGREFSTLLAIGLLALLFMNKFLQAPVGNLRGRPFASLAVGMLGFLLSFPIVMIVLALSLSIMGFLYLIGLGGVVMALGLVLGMVNIAGISLFYFVAIFGARALVGLAIGRLILRVVFGRNDVDEQRWLPYIALLTGVGLLSLIVSLPIVGILVNALALFLGLGAILNVVIGSFQRARDTTPTNAPVWYAPSPAVMREHLRTGETPKVTETQIPLPPPPPMGDEQTKPPRAGTTNLPDGFDWSFFED